MLDPRPKPFDVHVKGLGVTHVVHAPDPIDQGVSCDDTARIAQQHLEQLELLQRELDLLATHDAFVAPQIQDDIADLKDLVGSNTRVRRYPLAGSISRLPRPVPHRRGLLAAIGRAPFVDPELWGGAG